MGMFSWVTQDTDRSISNAHTGKVFTVYMHDDKGNRWREDEYEGYGEFGGKDYYELLSEMNGGPADREHGIDIAFSGREDIKYPNLVESYHWKWVDKKPKDCPRQGFFYDQYENEEDNEQTN